MHDYVYSVVPTVITTSAVNDDDPTECVETTVETKLLNVCDSRDSLNVTIGRAESGFKFGIVGTEGITGTMAALGNPDGGTL